MLNSVSLTFPDGSVREYDTAMTGAGLAESISRSLAKKAVACTMDGTLRDLSDPISKSGQVEIVLRDDPRALELIRHDTAHVLAEAVQELWPGTQVTIGPVIENGLLLTSPATSRSRLTTFRQSRKRCARSLRATSLSRRKSGRATAQKGVFRQGRALQARTDRRIPDDQDLKIYAQGDWFDLCRGPHGLDRADRQRLRADEGGRRLLARCSATRC